jgi:hypothetical protein
MTVGAFRSVRSFIFTSDNARSASTFNAAGADKLCLATSFSYFSRYIRIVAPADPVPLKRKTTRAASPLGYSKNNIRPCFEVRDPSTGSVYLIVSFHSHVLIESVDSKNMKIPRSQELTRIPRHEQV